MKTSTHTFHTFDDTELFYRQWASATPTDKAIVLFHRGHEHSGRWEEFVEQLALPDAAIFALDQRGHGRSPGPRGEAEHLGVFLKDMDEFVRHISHAHGIPVTNIIVVAHSVGAALVAAWVHDYAPQLRGMVLAAPAFRVKLYIPFAIPFLRLRLRLFGNGTVPSYVKAGVLTHDPAHAAAYDADPLITHNIPVNILLDLHDTSRRVVADAGAITVPTLLLTAGSDWVVRLGAQLRFLANLAAPLKEHEHFPGLYHALYHERDRHRPMARTREFIQRLWTNPPPSVSLLDAGQHGPMKTEYDQLRARKPFRLQRLMLRTLGRLSRGIRLGWEAGFDSGRMLDYVYANQPTGCIDRQYLNSIGWRGIRQRRVHLERTLRGAIDKLHAASQRVHILDIAAGPGRYVLETIRAMAPQPVTAHLRDYQSANIAAGRQLARELQVTGVTFETGDAFDRAALAAIKPRPTIAIVSGLYELFPANEPVRRSLQGLADVMAPGGYLIYTNQPWHPQLRFIAGVLTNREGQPWVMRRRSQAEMDELVRVAGFAKLTMEVDPWGIFTVSLARRE